MTPTLALAAMLLVAQAQEPAVVLSAEKAWAGADILWPLAEAADPAVSLFAVRAIGRLEDAHNVRRLLAVAQRPGAGLEAQMKAVAQSLNGFDPAGDPELVEAVSKWLRGMTFMVTPTQMHVVPGPIGNIKWSTPEQVHAAEGTLLRVLTWAQYDKTKGHFYLDAVRSLESLARLNARDTPFDPDTITRLTRIVAGAGINDGDATRENAVAALIAARALDTDTELVALKDSYSQVRRLATTVLGGAGAGLEEERRLDAIQERLGDPDGQVRYEAVKAYVRRNAPTRGCVPLTGLLTDRDTHVALAVIDALGDLCKGDDDVTTRILAEAVTPVGVAWHRGAHAFVALAKRAPDRAAMSMTAFVGHPSWWVRMYAARAAAAADDVVRLDSLAYDVNDNVREATLAPLRRLKQADAEPAIIAALDRSDVQLLRTTATLLKKSPPNARTARAILAALLRLTKEGKETSRDARVPLIEALAIHAGPEHAPELQPLLKDFDPVVAAKAATLITVTRGWPQPFADRRQCVAVGMASGKSFTLRMNAAAPVTVDRFLQLALADHYYDGLTIHRVAPNFVIQGGGPGANEYSGHKDYMRDEIGEGNRRGTVGLSTRGRNTADGQFFINLIDNARLDRDYTVFASVASGMTAVDAIEEGDMMQRLSSVRCPGGG
jgi:cyclophilin family peptidyl-prolyl cis-trans isomerase/HEAT repeat protein